MNFVDLHVHSNASDGTLSPSQVVSLAASNNLKAIALTDHDTVGGIPEAVQAAESLPMELIPGAELSCVWKGTEIHILGLFLDYKNMHLISALLDLQQIRTKRNRKMLELFRNDGFDITEEELFAGNPGTIITRAHFARVLTEKGYASDRNQAFKRYLQPGRPYYLPKIENTPEQVMELLKSSHAFISLAHPIQYKLGWKELETLILYLKELGLNGIEVYHSSHNQSGSSKLRAFCLAHSLLPTGGSDFHGANKPDIDIGCGRGNLRISYLLLEDIRNSLF